MIFKKAFTVNMFYIIRLNVCCGGCVELKQNNPKLPINTIY